MASPSVVSVTDSPGAYLATTIPANMPATVATGDMLFLSVAYYNAVSAERIITTPAGWTFAEYARAGSYVDIALFYKEADGTEGGTTLNLVESSGTNMTGMAQVARISGAAPTDVSVALPATQGGDGSIDSVTPTSLTTSWGADDNLFLVFGAGGRGGNPFTGFPAGYTNNSAVSGTDSGGYGVASAVCHKASTLATDSPSELTLATFYSMVALTVAVRGAGPSLTVTQTELTPGGTISGTYADYATVPTTLTVSDGTNTITIASPTINDNGDGTGDFSGTMPALPTSGTANLILFGDVDVELT